MTKRALEARKAKEADSPKKALEEYARALEAKKALEAEVEYSSQTALEAKASSESRKIVALEALLRWERFRSARLAMEALLAMEA